MIYNAKLRRYVIESLFASGFCVVSASTAFKLCPDRWATRVDCGTSFNDGPQQIAKFLQSLDGVKVVNVQFAGNPAWCLLATRSEDNLPSRINHITGQTVIGLRPFSGGQAMPLPVPTAAVNDPIPGYACVERTRRLEKAGLPDTLNVPGFKPGR
ncbi:MAG: hypothetical protein SGI92_15025 [Bryobacteraceae bacterium]|nr:hypothetical protein [Bryobacteraceae bacterium]